MAAGALRPLHAVQNVRLLEQLARQPGDLAVNQRDGLDLGELEERARHEVEYAVEHGSHHLNARGRGGEEQQALGDAAALGAVQQIRHGDGVQSHAHALSDVEEIRNQKIDRRDAVGQAQGRREGFPERLHA